MKIFASIFISMLLLVTVGAGQSYKYALHTATLDAVQLVDMKSGTTSKINGYQKTGGGYLIECQDPENTGIALKDAAKPSNIKIFDLSTQKASGWIELKDKKPIGIAAALRASSSESWWSYGGDLLDNVISFFNDCKNGSIAQGKDAAMKAGSTVFFKNGEEVTFSSAAAIHTQWTTLKTAEKITLKDSKGKVIWTNAVTNDPKAFKYQQLPQKAQKQLKRGSHYTLEVTCSSKGGSKETLKQHIYILNATEYKKLQIFVN